uniref:Odorant receptor n=1 Tax=Yemma signatus TaxID=300820 RepID=A0A385H5N4_9HEMI|nr:odorant receptor [Yemma signatus]
MYVIATSLFTLVKFNFTLATYLFQLYMLIQFSLLLLLFIEPKRRVFRRLSKEMITEFFTYTDEDHSELLRKLRTDLWTEKKMFLLLPALLCFIGASCMLLCPYLDSQFGDMGFNTTEVGVFTDTPIPAIYPFSITKENRSFYFYVLTLLQAYSAVFVVSLIASGTLICITFVFEYNLHLSYLIACLDNLEERATGHFSRTWAEGRPGRVDLLYADPRFQASFKKCLKKNFSHHQKLLEWISLVQDLFKWPVGFAYSTGTVVIALSLLSTKTGTSLPGTAFISFMMCILEIGIMGMISILGQRVTDLNEDLRRSVYNMKWYFNNSNIKSDITIFQEMSLRPVELKGFGLVTCNLETFSNVINSAYSYYNLIMAV